MPENGILYPDRFTSKILSLEAKGGNGTEVMLNVPSRVAAGEAFELGVSILDQNRLPSFANHNTELKVFQEGRPDNAYSVVFENGAPCTAKIPGASFKGSGFGRFCAEWDGAIFYSNPAYITESACGSQFWGDPHIHTTVGDCHADACRTRNLAYSAARWAYHLDWVALTDHISNGKRGTPGKWKDNRIQADLFNNPGRFTALIAYEASMDGGNGGDNNIYFREAPPAYFDPWESGLNTKSLSELLIADGKPFIMVPHHPTRAKKHGEISPEIYPGEKYMPLVEIHSKWGTSEYRGNPNALHNPHNGPSYVRDLLRHGYRMGFVGGTDTHTSLTFAALSLENPAHDRLPGLTAVLCPANTRESLFDGLSARHCYAASGERVYMDVAANGRVAMGDIAEASSLAAPPTLDIRCAAISPLADITIVRNGEEIASFSPSGWNADLRWQDSPDWHHAAENAFDGRRFVYYYVRVTAKSGARCWSSPVWLLD